jgi:hypothetical protein
VRHSTGSVLFDKGRGTWRKSLKRPHCIGHTLAISVASFSAYFNLKNRLARIIIVNDLDITELQAPRLIRPQSGIARETI